MAAVRTAGSTPREQDVLSTVSASLYGSVSLPTTLIGCLETRNPASHGGQVISADVMGFQLPSAPPQAMAPFNFASIPASSDPVVRYTVEQAMAQVRGADKKTRYMLMIEAAARQLAFQIALYEETVQEEQQQQGPPPAVMNDPDAP